MAHAIHDGRRLLWRTTSWLQHHWTTCQSCMRQERSGHRHPKWCWDRTPVSNLTLGTSWSLIRHCAPQLDGRANCCANGRLLMAMLQQKVQQSARTSVAGPSARTSGAGPSAKTYAAKRTIVGSERSSWMSTEIQTTKEGTEATGVGIISLVKVLCGLVCPCLPSSQSDTMLTVQSVYCRDCRGGGFKDFFVFTPTWGRFPIWLIQRGWNHHIASAIQNINRNRTWQFQHDQY